MKFADLVETINDVPEEQLSEDRRSRGGLFLFREQLIKRRRTPGTFYRTKSLCS